MARFGTSSHCERSGREGCTSGFRRLLSSRPLGSQLGAIASMQSEVIASREVLEAKLVALHEQYKDEPPQRPAHWGGFLVRPNEIEFWQGRPNRLHDRLHFTLQENDWVGQRLSP